MCVRCIPWFVLSHSRPHPRPHRRFRPLASQISSASPGSPSRYTRASHAGRRLCSGGLILTPPPHSPRPRAVCTHAHTLWTAIALRHACVFALTPTPPSPPSPSPPLTFPSPPWTSPPGHRPVRQRRQQAHRRHPRGRHLHRRRHRPQRRGSFGASDQASDGPDQRRYILIWGLIVYEIVLEFGAGFPQQKKCRSISAFFSFSGWLVVLPMRMTHPCMTNPCMSIRDPMPGVHFQAKFHWRRVPVEAASLVNTVQSTHLTPALPHPDSTPKKQP